MIPPARDCDGLPPPVCAVVCAWCKVSMGAKVCLPHQVNEVSHGICWACDRAMRVEAGLPTLVSGKRLESEEPLLRCGLAPADAGLPTPPLSPATGENDAPAAQAAGSRSPQGNGTTAVGGFAPEALEHHSGGTGASFTFNRPLFWLVQGVDFGRANAWARRTPNAVAVQIRARLGGGLP